MAEVEALAQHWGCPPDRVREQTEDDVAVAIAWMNAEAEARRQAEYFGSRSR